jgi:hypothetical protein
MFSSHIFRSSHRRPSDRDGQAAGPSIDRAWPVQGAWSGGQDTLFHHPDAGY